MGKMDETGQLKLVENVNELYDIWKDIKEDVLKESSQTDKEMTVNM